MEEDKSIRKPLDEYHKIEIMEIFERTRTTQNLRVQIFTFLGTANLTILGLAFNTQKVGFIFLATGTLLLLIVTDYAIRLMLSLLYCRGIQLEKQYSPDSDISLIHGYVAVSSQRNLFERLSKIAQFVNQEERIRALRAFRFSVIDPTFGLWLPGILILFEILLGSVLWLFANWKMV